MNLKKNPNRAKEYYQKNKEYWKGRQVWQISEYTLNSTWYKKRKKFLEGHPEIKKESNRKAYERLKQKLREKPELRKKYNARTTARKRRKGFLSIMNNPFPEEIPVDYHHIFEKAPFVIPMPKITHQYEIGVLVSHIEYNKKWINNLYCLNIDEIFSQ